MIKGESKMIEDKYRDKARKALKELRDEGIESVVVAWAKGYKEGQEDLLETIRSLEQRIKELERRPKAIGHGSPRNIC